MNGDRHRSDVLRLRRGRPAWAVPVLLFLAVLLVAALAFNLANLDTGGEALPPGSDASRRPPSPLLGVSGAIVDVLVIVLAGLFLAGAVYAMLFLRARVRRRGKARPWWEALYSVLGLLLVLALLFAWPRVSRLGQTANETADSSAAGTAGQNVTGWAAAEGPVALFLILAVLGVILAVTFLLRRSADRFRMDVVKSGPMPEERREATEAVRAAIVELEIGGDVRNAILACFQRFCFLLGNRGITEQVALTPRELERLAVHRLQVSPHASSTLTTLFEEARYSEHPLGEPDRVRAIDSLAGIRAALEA